MIFPILVSFISACGGNQNSITIVPKLPIANISRNIRYVIFFSEKDSLSCYVLYDTKKQRIEGIELNKNHDTVDSFLGMPEDEVENIVLHTKEKIKHFESKIPLPIDPSIIKKLYSLNKGQIIKLWNNSYRVETCYNGFVFVRAID